MMNFLAFSAFAITAAPVPRVPVDEWVGDQVFPKSQGITLMDEEGKKIGTWSVTPGKVSWANQEKVLLRHSQHPGPNVGYAMKSDLVRLADAPAFFTEKIQANQRDMWAWQNRAAAWTLKGDHDKAIKDLTEAIQLDPRAYMYVSRGNAWFAKKEHDKAIEDYSEAIRIDPNSSTGFINRGNVLSAKKEFEKAIGDFDSALRIDPKYTRAFVFRGNAWKNLKEYDKAIRDYDEAIRIDPKYASAYDNRGMTWAYKKEFEKAIKDYDEAIRLDPKNANAFYNKACSYALQGKTEPAIDNLQRSIELGYRNFEHIAKDTDFDSIRNEAAFKELMSKYKP
jgi:tetratricopeptide (TPR) repeat protein